MKTFYSEYVQHCMRFYARHPHPTFRSDADKQNWKACDSAVKNFSKSEQEMIMTVYREGDTIPDNIYNLALDLGIKQDIIWKLINELERKGAKRRGLL